MASLLQYIKKHGTWSFLVMAAIASTMTGAISFLAPLYPVMLAVAAAVCVTKMKKTSMPLVIMAAACVLSLAFNHPPAIFKPWYRLAYFLLLLLALTPLTSSRLLNAFRLNLFLWLMRFCVFIGAGSFIGYFLGINYMRYNTSEMINVAGLFGGLVWQSITLGLLAGLGLVYLTVLHLENRDSGRKETKLRLGLMVACLGSILLSASRSALVATLMGVGYVFFMYFRHAPKKLFRALLALFFLGILLVPFVQHFGANTLAKQQANLSMGSAMSSRTQLWEDRATEFLSSPLYGVGFASQKIISFKQSLVTGIIEPGTSYGAVFAMTGLLGGNSLPLHPVRQPAQTPVPRAGLSARFPGAGGPGPLRRPHDCGRVRLCSRFRTFRRLLGRHRGGPCVPQPAQWRKITPCNSSSGKT